MNTIYELDDQWKKLLSLNNFLGGLTVNEFVQELSKEHSGTSRGHGGSIRDSAFDQVDPKPYIRTFESVLRELKKLRVECESKLENLDQQVALSEISHAKNSLQLNDRFRSIVATHEALDQMLRSVTQVVSPLGEKLEKSIRSKNSYMKAVEVMTYYNDFNEYGKSKKLEQLRTSSNFHDKLQAALLVKQLLSLSRKIDTKSLPKTIEVTAHIAKYSEEMEKNLLDSFNAAYRKNDFDKLKEIALILKHFNGGINVIQSFINQHAYFANSEADEEHKTDLSIFSKADLAEKLNNPEIHDMFYPDPLIKNLHEMENTIKLEAKVVKRVFEERAADVLKLFVQQLMVKKIGPKVTLYMNTAMTISNLAYLRTLHAIYSLISQFIKDLSDVFINLDVDKDNILLNSLDQGFNELFSKIVFDRAKYFEVEKKCLESILFHKTSEFNLHHEKDIRNRNLLNKLSSNSEIKAELSGLVMHGTNSRLSKVNTFIKSHLERDRKGLSKSPSLRHSGTRDTVIDKNQEDPLYTLSYLDMMLKCAVESLARMMELIPTDSSDYCLKLVEVVMDGLISSYVDSALEVAYTQLAHLDPYQDGDLNLSYMKYVPRTTEMLSLISASVKAVIIPLLNNAPEAKKNVIKLVNAYLKKSELAINVLLEDTISFLDQKFAHILSKQNKRDFVPKSQEVVDQDTIPGSELVSVLDLIHSQVVGNLMNANLENFLTKVGTLLYEKLLDHYKRFQVSSVGGVIVTKDIIGYQSAIEEWGIDALNEKYALLRELANLFTIQPELLESLTMEGRLTTIGRNVISEYISKREDFNNDSFRSKFKISLM
ncbi:HBR128Cp [Eremothecium sinecaudum]|uniref:HBR128Cp n=1 Tax=Eremothecium sinecaudum TaxID=45286 RepID=A0A109UWX8_9SACH|nr:HBR128Cp [Eremothecium sinecaudum]AMD19029.1 HBR128Cp [Eremothecium sinecaudum]